MNHDQAKRIQTVVIRQLKGIAGWLILVQHVDHLRYKWYWSVTPEYPTDDDVLDCYSYGLKEEEFMKIEDSFLRAYKKAIIYNQNLSKLKSLVL
jgi:hypothetical protein